MPQQPLIISLEQICDQQKGAIKQRILQLKEVLQSAETEKAKLINEKNDLIIRRNKVRQILDNEIEQGERIETSLSEVRFLNDSFHAHDESKKNILELRQTKSDLKSKIKELTGKIYASEQKIEYLKKQINNVELFYRIKHLVINKDRAVVEFFKTAELTALDLSGAGIGDEHIEFLSECFQDSATGSALTYFILDNNRITSRSLPQLAQICQKLPIRCLSLSDNFITLSLRDNFITKYIFIDFLKQIRNTKLNTLKLDNNYIVIDKPTFQDLERQVAKNSELRHISISANLIENEDYKETVEISACRDRFFSSPVICRSLVDNKNEVSRDYWLMYFMLSKDNGIAWSDTHAFIVFEGINKRGQRYLWRFDLIYNNFAKKAEIQIAKIFPNGDEVEKLKSEPKNSPEMVEPGSISGAINVEQLKQVGLSYQAITGEGNCLYHAVGLFLGQPPESLRRTVVRCLEGDLQRFVSLFATVRGQNLEDYLDIVREGIEWNSHIDLQILMHVLNRPILVIGADNQIINLNDRPRFSGTPIFVYNNGQNHYDGLTLEEGLNPLLVLKRLLCQPVETVQQSLTQSNSLAQRRESINPLHGLFACYQPIYGALIPRKQAKDLIRNIKSDKNTIDNNQRVIKYSKKGSQFFGYENCITWACKQFNKIGINEVKASDFIATPEKIVHSNEQKNPTCNIL